MQTDVHCWIHVSSNVVHPSTCSHNIYLYSQPSPPLSTTQQYKTHVTTGMCYLKNKYNTIHLEGIWSRITSTLENLDTLLYVCIPLFYVCLSELFIVEWKGNAERTQMEVKTGGEGQGKRQTSRKLSNKADRPIKRGERSVHRGE